VDRQTFAIAGGCLPLLACTVVPLLVFGVLYGQWGTNLIWGLIFGFGWWVAQSFLSPEHWRAAASIGLFIWLPIVCSGLFLLSRAIWDTGDQRRRRMLMWLLVISSLPIVPADTALSLYADARVPPDFNVLVASW